MNPQLTGHGSVHDDCEFYEVVEEFIIDEGDHEIAEAPQISSGGGVTEHSDSQKLPHCPKQEDECSALTELSVGLQVPTSTSSAIHEIAEAPQIGSVGHVTEHSEFQILPSSSEKEDECSAVTEHSVDLHGSSSHILSSPALSFHSSSDTESTEALPTPNSEAEEENSAEKMIPSENDDVPAIGSSPFSCVTKTLLSLVVTTFAVIMVGKLLRP